MTSTLPNPALSRRRVVQAGAATAGTAALVSIPSVAEAAVVARYTRTPVPSRRERHVMDRFSYGHSTKLLKQMRKAGSPQEWFNQQLKPNQIGDRYATGLKSWFPSLSYSPVESWKKNTSGEHPLWKQSTEFVGWSLLRRTYSNRQLLEVMTEFWSNHLHIPAVGDGSYPNRVSYDAAIRRHALGSYENLLKATITHPAMLTYLDQGKSTKKAPNENLGRELLELHTVGRKAYTESDVLNSARILTGWKIDYWDTWALTYEPSDHWTGAVKVLGFSDRNSDPDGRELTYRYLTYLARHPETAKRIARKVAVRFVSDNPSNELVNHLTRVYLRNGTSIKAVLRAVINHPEFWKSVGGKVRTPNEDYVATYRAMGVRVTRPTADDSAARSIIWQAQSMGQRPFGWPRPDGEPDDPEIWSSVGRMAGSFGVHYTIAGGWWPSKDIRYRPYAKWLPQRRIRLNALVDHMSRKILGRKSTPALLDAVILATGYPASEIIDAEHPLARWRMPVLLQTLLDTPEHMTR